MRTTRYFEQNALREPTRRDITVEMCERIVREPEESQIQDNGLFYEEIPGFDSVGASAATLEECCEELKEVFEGWIVLSLSRNLPLPTVDGISLDVAYAS